MQVDVKNIIRKTIILERLDVIRLNSLEINKIIDEYVVDGFELIETTLQKDGTFKVIYEKEVTK